MARAVVLFGAGPAFSWNLTSLRNFMEILSKYLAPEVFYLLVWQQCEM